MPTVEIVFVVLLLHFTASSHGQTVNQPLATARTFQNILDTYAQQRKASILGYHIVDEFVFEGCGVRLLKQQFVNFLMTSNFRGVVIDARADRNNVIYKMNYGPKKIEVTIRQLGNRHFLTKAKEIIC